MHPSLPQHIAIVMDGNGRWAQSRQLSRLHGHIAGVETVRKIVHACVKHQISILSLFAFSSENWKRPEEEVSGLMKLFLQSLQQEVEELNRHQVQLRFTGNLDQLPLILQKEIKQAEQLTKHHSKLILNLVINYGGKWDITQAAIALGKKIKTGALQVEDLSEDLFASHLATARLPDPDLFIRTSGEHRISNFYLWQLAYTELYFTPVYWPDFDEAHLLDAIQNFQNRQRRFGQLNQEG